MHELRAERVLLATFSAMGLLSFVTISSPICSNVSTLTVGCQIGISRYASSFDCLQRWSRSDKAGHPSSMTPTPSILVLPSKHRDQTLIFLAISPDCDNSVRWAQDSSVSSVKYTQRYGFEQWRPCIRISRVERILECVLSRVSFKLDPYQSLVY